MNNKVVIAVLVVLLLVVLAGGAFLMARKSSPLSQTQTVVKQQTTLKSLLASGKGQKCSFDNGEANLAQVIGTVYVGSGKMRGDFDAIAVGNVPVRVHMIFDSQNFYSWDEGSKQGHKFVLDAQGQTADKSGFTQAIGMNQTGSFACSDWTVDNSMLSLPSDVSFADLVLPTPPGSGAPEAISCSSCDAMQGDARDACRVQLRCQ